MLFTSNLEQCLLVDKNLEQQRKNSAMLLNIACSYNKDLEHQLSEQRYALEQRSIMAFLNRYSALE